MSPAPTVRPLPAFWNQCSFSIGDVDLLWIDVTLAAMVHGEWSAFERRLAEGLACATRADREGIAPAEHAVDEVATAFRYERDLISASDMNAWLDRTGLSTADWIAYVTRDVLRRMWSDDMDAVLDRFAPSPRQLEAAAVAEGICSGFFDAFAESFGGRASLAFEADADVFQAGRNGSAAEAAAAEAETAARLVRQHEHWLAIRPEAETSLRLAAIVHVDAVYHAACEQAVSEQSLRESIEVNRLDWVLLDVDTMRFPNEDAAREAVLCVTEDGLSLHDVAALSRQPVTRRRVFLADLPPENRDRLLSAEAGRVLGPLPVDDRFEVTAVIGRTAPTLDDDCVAERARRAVVEQAARRAARDHVRRRSL